MDKFRDRRPPAPAPRCTTVLKRNSANGKRGSAQNLQGKASATPTSTPSCVLKAPAAQSRRRQGKRRERISGSAVVSVSTKLCKGLKDVLRAEADAAGVTLSTYIAVILEDRDADAALARLAECQTTSNT